MREELANYGVDHYLVYGGELDDLFWRRLAPLKLFQKVKSLVEKRLY
jgi:hypothetical protein